MISFTHFPAAVLAFFLEIFDASFGLGYGTALTPVLLIIGFDPLQVVPAVLLSQLVGDFLAAFCHHKFKNVNLSLDSNNFMIAITLGILGSIGSIIAVVIATNLPKIYLHLYIGTLVAILGLIVVVTRNRNFDFSWTRLLFLGFLAAFNKGLSGGGYGPLVSGGQILTGIDVKKAIGITSFAEGITCIVAVMTYLLKDKNFDLSLVVWLSIGVTLSGPISAFIVRKIEISKLKVAVGILNIVLGLFTVLKTL